ncbi:MAG TPA: hypothetical protein VIE65_07540 [Methylobacter sp.]|jgi:hypothetical protein
MVAFYASSDLSRGDLRLFLTNEDGYATDAFRVGWTIYSLTTGSQISGKNLLAIKAATGEYYAPWNTKTINGNYYIEWDIQETASDCITKKVQEKFFIIEPSAYQCCPIAICNNGQPAPGGFAYLMGSQLGPGDLPLFLKNSDGFPVNAFAVFWTILNQAGFLVVPKTAASMGVNVGEYFADWFVSAPAQGNYTIRWEFIENDGDPVQSASMGFSIISPGAFMVPSFSSCFAPAWMKNSCRGFFLNAGFCSCSCDGAAPCGPLFPCSFVPSQVPPVSNNCCDFELSRVVHLDTQTLMPGGAFTEQPPFNIPTRVRRVAFYITYTRGAPGGYAIMRLLWGNGIEETQTTIISGTVFPVDPSTLVAQAMRLSDLMSPIPVTNAPVMFSLEAGVPGGATTVRLLAAEGGVPGAPGTIAVSITASTG